LILARRIATGSLAFTLLLGAMGALPPLSIDMGLPALPILQRALSTTETGSGLTLSLFLAGFAAAQLALGPLSDRIGRRPVLLGGLAVFTLAGIGCATSGSITALVLWRLLQGMGAASGTVLAFAIVRDLFEGNAMRTKLSYVTMVLSVAPIIAPTLGGWMLLLGGWRPIYGLLAVAGLLLTSSVAIGLGETRRPHPARHNLLASYSTVLGHRSCIGFALVNACNFGTLFAYVSGSPALMIGSLGVSTQLYGVLFACTAGGILAGAWLNGWLSRRGASAHFPVTASLVVSAATAALLLVLAVSGHVGLGLLMPLLIVNTGCRGMVGPGATHLALAPLPQLAGAASALLGFLQMGTGALSSAIVALLYAAFGPAGMMATMLLFALAALAAARFAVAGGGQSP